MDKKTKTYIILAVIVLVAIALVYTYLTSSGNSKLPAFDNQPISLSTYLQLKAIATNTTLADAVGQGIAGTTPFALPTKINGTPISINGKPGVVYVGAEYCPYCAASRWSLILALMRFGDFNQLHYMTSAAAPEVYPITPTFTFYNSTYNSSYISFDPTEIENNVQPYQPLQPLDGIANSTFYAYDNGGIPFIDFGNKSIQSGASFYPSVINNGNQWDWSQVIAQMNSPNTTVSQAVIGAANIFTAQICSIDNFTPASVCDQPYVSEILGSKG